MRIPSIQWYHVKKYLYVLISFSSISALSGCVSISPAPVGVNISLPTLDLACKEYAALIRRKVKVSGYQDNQFTLVYKYPELRMDRFLESFRFELNTDAKREAWFDLLFQHARSTRQIELFNVWPDFPALHHDKLEACHSKALEQLLENKEMQQAIIERAVIKDNYRDWQRILGASAVVGTFVNRQVDKWRQAQERKAKQQVWKGWENALLYQPKAVSVNVKGDYTAWMEQARSRHPLGVPLLDDGFYRELFDYYAPTWLLENDADYNQPGSPTRGRGGQIEFSLAHPVIYTYITYSRLYDQVLLQLNYVIWFSERPKPHSLDLYGGQLDGLIFRITLDEDGSPLIYDSVHNCGCYHTLFSLKPDTRIQAGKGEPIYIVRRDLQTHRPVIVINSAEHIMIDVIDPSVVVSHFSAMQPREYSLIPYDRLREAKPLRLFNQTGMLPDTERLERFFLWPFGIYSPGAMRQAGHHAAAFTSIRHFDDARLLENWLKVQLGSPK